MLAPPPMTFLATALRAGALPVLLRAVCLTLTMMGERVVVLEVVVWWRCGRGRGSRVSSEAKWWEGGREAGRDEARRAEPRRASEDKGERATDRGSGGAAG